MLRFLEHRIGDRRLLRLIGKWLKAGVMEEGVIMAAETETPQGAVVSPTLANVYLYAAVLFRASSSRTERLLRSTHSPRHSEIPAGSTRSGLTRYPAGRRG